MPSARLFSRCFLLAALCSVSLTLSTASAAPATAEDEKAIMQIERDACNAYLHADADYLDKLLTSDFWFTDGHAGTNDKAAELAEVRKAEIKYSRFENRDMVLRLHGDTAVVTGITAVEGAPAGGKPFAIEVRFTDVFTRLDGQWRMLAGHVSRIPGKGS